MRKIIFTVILIYFSAILKGQAVREILTGKISFVAHRIFMSNSVLLKVYQPEIHYINHPHQEF